MIKFKFRKALRYTSTNARSECFSPIDRAFFFLTKTALSLGSSASLGFKVISVQVFYCLPLRLLKHLQLCYHADIHAQNLFLLQSCLFLVFSKIQ